MLVWELRFEVLLLLQSPKAVCELLFPPFNAHPVPSAFTHSAFRARGPIPALTLTCWGRGRGTCVRSGASRP